MGPRYSEEGEERKKERTLTRAHTFCGKPGVCGGATIGVASGFGRCFHHLWNGGERAPKNRKLKTKQPSSLYGWQWHPTSPPPHA